MKDMWGDEIVEANSERVEKLIFANNKPEVVAMRAETVELNNRLSSAAETYHYFVGKDGKATSLKTSAETIRRIRKQLYTGLSISGGIDDVDEKLCSDRIQLRREGVLKLKKLYEKLKSLIVYLEYVKQNKDVLTRTETNKTIRQMLNEV